MSWSNPAAPNLGDYTLWIQNTVGISTVYLPANSPFLSYAFNRALAIVFNPPTSLAAIEYVLAVYNCATHIQLKITPDQSVNGIAYTYFRDKRAEFQLLNPVVGLVLSSSDEGTSVSNAVPDAMRQLTISDLDFMKTAWGREYLAFQQDYGPTLWMLS